MRARGWAAVAATAAVFAGVSVLLGSASRALGAAVPLTAVGLTGAALGVLSSPPVRSALERRARGSSGLASLALGCLLLSSLLCQLGLAALVPAACVTAAVYAVLLEPSRRRFAESTALSSATSALSTSAQAMGWVDAFLTVPQTALAQLTLLTLTAPSVLYVARTSRRAQSAAADLEDQRRRHLAELEHAALHEPTTQVLNRRGLREVLRAPLDRAAQDLTTAVLCVDLDGFTALNTVHGVVSGDLVLVEVARRLERCAGPGGAVARTGADEFVVVLRGLPSPAAAHEVAARMSRDLALPVALPDGSSFSVGASTGLALGSGRSPVLDLLVDAGAAMQQDRRRARPRSGPQA